MMVEMVPASARPPVEAKAPIRGVSRVVPQVGQPAPRAISPVMMPAFWTLAELSEWARFLCQSKAIRPIRTLWSVAMAKIGSQSRKGLPMPKMARKESARILMVPEKPVAYISSNLEKPPERRFISMPKKMKLIIKPIQKRFSLVASKMPLLAKIKPSNHFLQFIIIIITYVFLLR